MENTRKNFPHLPLQNTPKHHKWGTRQIFSYAKIFLSNSHKIFNFRKIIWIFFYCPFFHSRIEIEKLINWKIFLHFFIGFWSCFLHFTISKTTFRLNPCFILCSLFIFHYYLGGAGRFLVFVDFDSIFMSFFKFCQFWAIF